MKTIVVSGINLVEGGTLSIFQDCLSFLNTTTDKYKIIALVHKKELFKQYNNSDIIFMEFPYAKRSWLFRIIHEYLYFHKLSKEIKPYLWLSLHDITPNVDSKIRAVYCHNSSPFYRLNIKDYLTDMNFTLFTLFYKYLYKLNIEKNDFVIVQQDWIRNEFKQIYGIDNIIVAHPKIAKIIIPDRITSLKTFIYPTFPRIFKNIEVICEAFKLIDDIGAKVFITIDGSENLYARKIVTKYSLIKSISFIGLQTRETIFDYYGKAAALIFPSRLETWGMPLSEFAQTGKPIFASDTNFCRETLASYKNAVFFQQDNAVELANFIKRFVCDNEFIPHDNEANRQPDAQNWEELFAILIKNFDKV